MRGLYLSLVFLGIPLLIKAQENTPTKPMVNDTDNVTETVPTKEPGKIIYGYTDENNINYTVSVYGYVIVKQT